MQKNNQKIALEMKKWRKNRLEIALKLLNMLIFFEV